PDVGVADMLAAGAFGPGLPQSTASRRAGSPGLAPVRRQAHSPLAKGSFAIAHPVVPCANRVRFLTVRLGRRVCPWPISEGRVALGEDALCRAKRLLTPCDAPLARVTWPRRNGGGPGESARAAGGTIPPPRNAPRLG